MRKDRFFFSLASQQNRRLTYLTAEKAYELGRSYHVVGTYDGRRMTLYVDGEPAATADNQSGAIEHAPGGWFTIGSYRDNDEHYPIQGEIREAALYEGVLTAEQIRKPYRAHPRDAINRDGQR